MKLLQNRIAQDTKLLPVMGVAGLLVWLIAGVIEKMMWPQLCVFVVSVYLMVELSNSNALMRIRSRMVSAVFITFSSTTCFLYGHFSGGMAQLCFILFLQLLFQTYQSPQRVGIVYYAFLTLGVGSLFFAKLVWLMPLLWLLMATQLQVGNWRATAASVFGLLTPYWLIMPWFLWQGDMAPVMAHLHGMMSLPFPGDYTLLTVPLVSSFVFIALLTVVGIIHFWYYSFEDKVRIRLIFGLFATLAWVLMVLVVLMPQESDSLMRLLIVVSSPLVAHFFTFTHSRVTNVFFIVCVILAVALTVLSLWMPSLSF